MFFDNLYQLCYYLSNIINCYTYIVSMELQLFKNLGQNMVDPNNPTQYFQFIASRNGSNINLFADSGIPADTYYIVNGERSQSPINSLSFSAGDDVKICYGRYAYDSFSCDNQNYFTSITGAIPRLTTKTLMHVFNGCNSLQTIPCDLFVNNPQLTNLYNCFQFCSSLTAIIGETDIGVTVAVY